MLCLIMVNIRLRGTEYRESGIGHWALGIISFELNQLVECVLKRGVEMI